MNKLITILTLLALTLPISTLAQPEEGPREQRPEREREFQRDRGDRPSGDRTRPGEGEVDRGDRGDWRSRRESVTVEQVDEALATLRELHGDTPSEWMQRIETQAKENPEDAARSLSPFPRMLDMMYARKHKPEEFKLHIKQFRLMREFFPLVHLLKEAQRNEDQPKIDELKPQVREIIGKLFEVRMEFKELEIKEIRDKLTAAEIDRAEIEAERESHIDERLNEILNGRGPRGGRDEGDRPDRPEGEPRPVRDGRPGPEGELPPPPDRPEDR